MSSLEKFPPSLFICVCICLVSGTMIKANNSQSLKLLTEVSAEAQPRNDTVTISDIVTNGIGTPMANVRVAASNPNGVSFGTKTGENGAYTLQVFKEGEYFLHLYKWTEPDNGVNGMDLTEFRRMLLGIDSYDPYQLLCGDIDLDGYPSTTDLAQLQKYSLFGIDYLPTKKDFNFTNPITTTQPPFLIDLSFFDYNTEDGNVEKDFIGFKVGDVNYSADY